MVDSITIVVSGTDQNVLEAARFYAVTFPDSKVTGVHEAPGDYLGGRKGEVLTEESQCGWCTDRWGLSWQITPRVLTDALAANWSPTSRPQAACRAR